MNIDELFADDVTKKTEGVKVKIPGIDDAYLVLKAFNATAYNEAMRVKALSFEDKENPTDAEARSAVCHVYVEQFISGWGGVKENDIELVDNLPERLRIFCNPQYERFMDFAIAEMNNINNYRLKEKEKAKKH